MQDIKKSLQKLCIDNDTTLLQVLDQYNEQHGTRITNQSFYRTLSQGTIKAAMLDDVLHVLGYELAMVKRE